MDDLGLNDIYDFENVVYQQPLEGEGEEKVTPPAPEEESNDLITDFLKTRGIEDPSKIQFEEDGNIVEKNWNDLSREEQLNILSTPLEETPPAENNNELSEDEIKFINLIRDSGMSPEEYVNSLQPSESPEPFHKVDDFSDEELFLLDFETRLGESLTEEQEAEVLARAKQDEEIFKKQVEGIRKEYKEREDYESQQKQLATEQEQEAQFNEFKDSILSAINGIDSIGGLIDLEDNDKDDLAQFILSTDETGSNYLTQALQDPETLAKAAWFILNGDEVFDNIKDYYTSQIKLLKQQEYNRGLEDGKKGVKPKPTVVMPKSKPVQVNNNNGKELDYDEIEF